MGRSASRPSAASEIGLNAAIPSPPVHSQPAPVRYIPHRLFLTEYTPGSEVAAAGFEHWPSPAAGYDVIRSAFGAGAPVPLA
jgi:hypothetical protein